MGRNKLLFSKWKQKQDTQTLIGRSGAILVDNGCKWRALPHDYPKWSTVKSFYYRAVGSGLWEKIMDFLVRETRKRAGRSEEPSYCLIDSQSTKTVAASDERGIDGGKKDKGT